ncbi:MAG: replicative DNA helicase [Urechidicola sp.]|jgi:replicative DNA helicase|tara:strand:- start:10138 stop:11712 length:1575 start_codon:yes stop_codon:yes gene_type:complete
MNNELSENDPVARMAKKKKQPSFYQESGRIPPQAVDFEEAVLGALMLEKNAVNDVIDVLSPESFYKDPHQKIYGVIHHLFGHSQPIDILTVTQELRNRGELEYVGGAYYISQLTNRIASAANVEHHARIIAQKFIQRELIRISSETIKLAYDETTDVFDLLDKAESSLFQVAEGNLSKSYERIDKVMQQAIEEIENAQDHEDGVSGIPTGFTALDRVTSGWQKSDMIVIAARPGMGKTAFVVSMARNAAVQFGKAVAIFSLEMSSVQLVNRLISGETEIPAEKLRKGNLERHEYEQLHARIGKLSEAPFFIDDTPALSIFEFRAKCRRLKAQHDVQLIIIDYLQLMTGGGEGKGNREQEISFISRSIKTVAKELEVPIIALSQLSRSVETRGGDKRPILSDLRESGAIEQDADIVSFIYRPEYYGLTTDEETGDSLEGIGEFIIAKHRNGSLESIKLRFVGQFAKFENLDSFSELGANSISPNGDFENGDGTMTMKSKGWDDQDSGDDFTDASFDSEEEDDEPF